MTSFGTYSKMRVAVALSLVVVSGAFAASTVFVNKTNTGPTYDGTSEGTAWTNIQDAVNDPNFVSSLPGTIIVGAGMYNEQVSLSAATSGTIANTNSIIAKAGETPIINGGGTRAYGIYFNTGTTNILIKGFKITGTTSGGIAGTTSSRRRFWVHGGICH